jgi:hypothetical protein
LGLTRTGSSEAVHQLKNFCAFASIRSLIYAAEGSQLWMSRKSRFPQFSILQHAAPRWAGIRTKKTSRCCVGSQHQEAVKSKKRDGSRLSDRNVGIQTAQGFSALEPRADRSLDCLDVPV